MRTIHSFNRTYNTCLFLRNMNPLLYHVQSTQVIQDRAKRDAMYQEALR